MSVFGFDLILMEYFINMIYQEGFIENYSILFQSSDQEILVLCLHV